MFRAPCAPVGGGYTDCRSSNPVHITVRLAVAYELELCDILGSELVVVQFPRGLHQDSPVGGALWQS